MDRCEGGRVIARGEEPTPEQLFAEFKSLVRIHLKQILTLDRKPPIYAVALLVAVGCEQISRLFPAEGSAEEVFSKAIIEPHGVSRRVGRDLFDVIRNGFAHSYCPKMLQIDDGMVGVTFAWKKEKRAHLCVGGIQSRGGHNIGVPLESNETGYRWLVIVGEELWRSLDTYLADLETRVIAGTAILDSSALWPMKGPIRGTAAEEWRKFLDSRTVHIKGIRHS
jgi:hypothetical protein